MRHQSGPGPPALLLVSSLVSRLGWQKAPRWWPWPGGGGQVRAGGLGKGNGENSKLGKSCWKGCFDALLGRMG